jgi:probable rRNA maturation factor
LLIQKILREAGRPESGILGVIFVDHKMSRTINRQFLAHDYPTDVIAFEYGDDEDEKWGEIYVNVQKAREQAIEYGVSYEDELTRLIIHGLLHLTGYDDQNDASRAKMKRREDELVEWYASVLNCL